MRDYRKYKLTAVGNSENIGESNTIQMDFTYEGFVVGKAIFDGYSYEVNPLDESIDKSNPYRRVAFDIIMKYGINSVFNGTKIIPEFMSGKAIGKDKEGILLENAKNLIINRGLEYQNISNEKSKEKIIIK